MPSRPCPRLARQREHVFEKLQMGHEGEQVALQCGLAALGEGQQIVPTGLWDGLPKFPPSGCRHTIGKTPRAHHHRRWRQIDDSAGCKTDMERMIGRPQQAVDIQAGSACDKRGIRLEQHGKTGERRNDLGVVLTYSPGGSYWIILLQTRSPQ